jgi:hypothetical protein
VTISPDMTKELRQMVRAALREVMPARTGPGASATSPVTLPSGPLAGGPTVEQVRIAGDQDLAAFVAHLVDPATLDRVRSGALRFTLAGAPSSVGPQPLSGVVSERRLDGLPAGSTLVLAPGAVLTPLARDRARRLGMKIERSR